MKKKMNDDFEIPILTSGCELGEIELNPNTPSVTITPNRGRRVLITGNAAQLLLSFMCHVAAESEQLRETTEHTDGIPYYA